MRRSLLGEISQLHVDVNETLRDRPRPPTQVVEFFGLLRAAKRSLGRSHLRIDCCPWQSSYGQSDQVICTEPHLHSLVCHRHALSL